MLTTFFEKLGGLFDNRFIIAYWAPAFISLGLASGLIATNWGYEHSFIWWNKLDPIGQVWLGVAALLTVTVMAYLLQVFTLSVVRFYEGYTWPRWIANKSLSHQLKVRQALRDSSNDNDNDQEKMLLSFHQPGAYRALYNNFPRETILLRPTRLGNTLTAAEEYPYQIYRLDSIIWWPRLVPLLPDTFRSQVSDALTPLLTILNLSILFTLLAGESIIFMFLNHQIWWEFLLIAVGAWLLAWLCYQASIAQAASYGSVIRIAFDLYRHAILKQMHIPIPDNIADERQLWDTLNQWVYRYIPPWESKQPQSQATPASKTTDETLYYDTHTTPTESKAEQIQVTIEGSPTLTLQQKEIADH